MKKKSIVGFSIIICIITILCGLYLKKIKHRIVSYSEKNNNEYTQNIIDDYSEKYHHEFELASAELESQLYGVWQAKEFVGWDNSREIQWDGLYGDVIIFSRDAWVYGGHPGYKPVYACYSADFEDMRKDLFLNMAWKDNRYEGCAGFIGIAVSSEKNGNLGSAAEERILKFIFMEDNIIIEAYGSYFRLEKVGEIEMNDLFKNVKPNETIQ